MQAIAGMEAEGGMMASEGGMMSSDMAGEAMAPEDTAAAVAEACADESGDDARRRDDGGAGHRAGSRSPDRRIRRPDGRRGRLLHCAGAAGGVEDRMTHVGQAIGEARAKGGDLVRRHRLSTRIWHWVNVVVFVVMLMSGLMIFNAHPRLYWGEYGANFDPAWLEIGGEDGRGYPAGRRRRRSTPPACSARSEVERAHAASAPSPAGRRSRRATTSRCRGGGI